MDPALLGRAARQRQLERLEVARGPRAGSPPRGRASSTAPWPGTTWSACSTSGAGAPASRGRPSASRPRTASGSRPVRGNPRRRALSPTGSRSPCRPATWPSVGCSSSSRVADLELAGHGQRLELAERRAGAGARRSARRRSRAARAPRRRARRSGARPSSRRRRARASGKARRPSRWSQSPCVASSPEHGQPTCSSSAGSDSSSSGSTGESITKASAPSPSRSRTAHDRAGRLPVADVQTRTSACRPTTRTGAAPRRRRAAWPPRAAS